MTEVIHYRGFDIAEVNEDRTIEGVLAPYSDTFRSLSGYEERYERGVFGDVANVSLYYNHDHRDNHSATVIGRVIETRDDEDGLHIKAKLSTTPKAEEVYTLLRDGSLSGLSAGFIGQESRTEDGVTIWTKAHLLEASVVPDPAYKAALVSRVRSNNTMEVIENNNMGNETTNSTEVVELRSAVETQQGQITALDRKVASLSVATHEAPATSQFRSMGEAVQALYRGDRNAEAEFRAYTGSTAADADVTRPGFVSRELRLAVDGNRDVWNAFASAPLPATGNYVEYPFVLGESGSVAAQALEGDNLTLNKVQLDTATAPVVTWGGYSEISLTAIERSDLAFLEVSLQKLAREYAKATNDAVRAGLVGATGTNTGTALSGVDTAQKWLDLVIDADALIDDNSRGERAEFMLVSRAVYKRVVHMVDNNGRPLFAINNDGSNTVGSLNVKGISGSIAGIPVVVDAGLTGNTVYVCARDAITTYEQPGAPFRLQDQNIVNLTRQFSLYGRGAIAVTNPKAIVKVSAGTGV